MFEGSAVLSALLAAQVSHVVWIPDSTLGQWDAALSASQQLRLLRVCREGEAFALAAGLHIGGARPIVVMQCTGLFEAGDALRNIIHDLRIPLFTIVGVRSWYAHLAGRGSDTCPRFVEPILHAWQIPCTTLDPAKQSVTEITQRYLSARAAERAEAILLAE